MPAGRERAWADPGVLPSLRGLPSVLGPAAGPGHPYPVARPRRFWEHPHLLAGPLATGWASQAPGTARETGQLVLRARRALRCFSETEAHAILIEPSSRPISAVRPRAAVTALASCGSPLGKETKLASEAVRRGGGREEGAPHPHSCSRGPGRPQGPAEPLPSSLAPAPPSSPAPTPALLTRTSELASPHPRLQPRQTPPHVARGHLLRPGLCQMAA